MTAPVEGHRIFVCYRFARSFFLVSHCEDRSNKVFDRIGMVHFGGAFWHQGFHLFKVLKLTHQESLGLGGISAGSIIFNNFHSFLDGIELAVVGHNGDMLFQLYGVLNVGLDWSND